MLHRAILGTFERFIGILIEHHAGKFPLWLAPVQAVVATIVSDADDYAREVAAKLAAAGIRVETDLRNEKINYKVREHSLAKVPLLLVVGKREAEEGTVALRRLGSDEHQKMMSLDEAIAMIADEAMPPDLRLTSDAAPPQVAAKMTRLGRRAFSIGRRAPTSPRSQQHNRRSSYTPALSAPIADAAAIYRPPLQRVHPVPEGRVIDENGENLGVMFTREAFEQAQEVGLDLVEISPNADPPVAKFLDIGRYKYEAQKKANEQRKKQKTQEIKEIKMRPNIDDHDYDMKMKKVVEFLEEGDKVKVTMRFRGREMAHGELGMAVLRRVQEQTADMAKVEAHPRMEGRQMLMVLAPK